MINFLLHGFSQLNAREQRLLIIATPLALALLVGLWVNSEYQRYRQIAVQHDQMQQRYEQLLQQAQPLQRWREQVGTRSLGSLSGHREAGLLLNEGLSRFQLRGEVRADADAWLVDIQGDGNRMLGYVEAARASGLRLQGLSISRNSDRGDVTAQVRFVDWSAP